MINSISNETIIYGVIVALIVKLIMIALAALF